MMMSVKVIKQFYKFFKIIIHLLLKSVSSQNYPHFIEKELDMRENACKSHQNKNMNLQALNLQPS